MTLMLLMHVLGLYVSKIPVHNSSHLKPLTTKNYVNIVKFNNPLILDLDIGYNKYLS